MTCENIDLSNYVDELVCIDFRTGGCQFSDHFGYAYIDGLCNSNFEDNSPIVSLNAIPTFCNNQEVIVDPSLSARYNNFQWNICVTPQGGVETCYAANGDIPLTEPQNILGIIHETNPNVTLSCPSTIEVTLTLTNDCNLSDSKSITIDLICQEYEVDYENILLCSETVPNVDVSFEGINSCTDGEYSWNPNYTLQNSNSAFPTIMGTVNENAFEQTYVHQTISSEGCIYKDRVDILRFTKIVPLTEATDLCDNRMLKAKVYFSGGLELEHLLTLTYSNVNIFPGILIPEESTSEFLVYEFLEFNQTSTIGGEIIATVTGDDYFFVPTESCALRVPVNIAPEPNLFGDILLKNPLASSFTPNGDGDNDTWGPELPDGYNDGDENVFYARVRIRNEWNNIAFDTGDVFSVFPNPINYNDLRWDGLYQGGEPAVSGVYTFKVWLKNCEEGSTFVEGDFIAHGNITLIR